MMAPAYEQAARLLEPHLRVAKLDTEQAQAIAGRLQIRSIPTLALFVGGREIARQPGALTRTDDIVRWARGHLP
jgi:thioredoxin 2